MLTAAADRFERRLAEECGSLRVEMAGLRADLRQEMAGLRADLRQEMAQQLAAVQDMAAGFTGIHKWAFLFWTGQLLVVMALFGLLVGMGR